MPEKDPNLEWNLWGIDLGSIDMSTWQEMQDITQVNDASSWPVLPWISEAEDIQNQEQVLSSDVLIGNATDTVAWEDLYWTGENMAIDGIDPSKLDLGIDGSENVGVAIDENLLCWLYEAFKFIDSSEKNIYIHCVMGVSRSASVTIGYLMYKQKI